MLDKSAVLLESKQLPEGIHSALMTFNKSIEPKSTRGIDLKQLHFQITDQQAILNVDTK